MSAWPQGLAFVKYEGAGNDFVCLDDRTGAFGPFELPETIQAICNRHFGVGADGLILLRQCSVPAQDGLQLVYYNSDGAPSSFCGNGSRCFALFAADLGLATRSSDQSPASALEFLASDGQHTAHYLQTGAVRVSMRVHGDVSHYSEVADLVDTGSPHFIQWCERLPSGDLRELGREIRYRPAFAKTGINVNFVVEELGADGTMRLRLRTYERGVEDETLACGTGVTAAVLSFAERRQLIGEHRIEVEALGGSLAVQLFREKTGDLREIWLEGPARRVFAGNFA